MATAIPVSYCGVDVTRSVALAGAKPSHDTTRTMTSTRAHAIRQRSVDEEPDPAVQRDHGDHAEEISERAQVLAGAAPAVQGQDERQKLRVLSPAKADQCSAARRTSPMTHDPSKPDRAEHALHDGVHRECDVGGGQVGGHRPRSMPGSPRFEYKCIDCFACGCGSCGSW
jgi:hypothetical protein